MSKQVRKHIIVRLLLKCLNIRKAGAVYIESIVYVGLQHPVAACVDARVSSCIWVAVCT